MSGLSRDVVVMASGTMTSRVFGLIRGIMLAGVIGATGLTADVFQVANSLPNSFYALVAGGVLNSILVPQIVKSRTHDDGGESFVNRIITLAAAFLLGSSLLITLLAPVWVRLFASPKMPPDAVTLTTIFAWICLPQVFFYGLYTLLGQVLNARGIFWPYVWAPVLANLVAIAGLVWFDIADYPVRAPVSEWTWPMILTLGGSATLSIVIQALALLIPLRRSGFRYRPVWGVRGVGLGTTSRIAGWTFASVAVSQAGLIVASQALTRAAAYAEKNGLTLASRGAFDNAFLIFILPHSLITVSLVTALFARISRAVSDGDPAAVRSDYRSGLLTIAPLLIPIIAVVVAFAPLVTSTLFFRNPVAETSAVAVMVQWMTLGALPYGWLYLNDRMFYAHDDARTPFLTQVTVTSTAVVFAVAALLGSPARTGSIIGIGQSTAYVIGAVLGVVLLHRRLGSVGMGEVIGTYARLIVPAIGYAVALRLVVDRLWPDIGAQRGPSAFAVGAASLGGLLLVHLTLTWATAYALGVRSIGDLVRGVLSRLRRRATLG